MTEIANSENTITLDMVAIETPVAGAYYDAYGGIIGSSAGYSSTELNIEPAPTINPYQASYVAKASPNVVLGKKTICYDTETTGVNPWEYRLLGCSFWDLNKPITTMETFFSFDEEQLTRDIAEYLNREKPEILVQYNNGYDERALLTRFMLYQVKVPGWNDIVQVDVMQILCRGTTQSIYSSQPNGSDEQWYKYFFNEVKPYNIAECFEGVRNLDLYRMRTRNRTCVQSEGLIYLLFRHVTDAEESGLVETQSTQVYVDEEAALGKYLIVCPTCYAENVVLKDSHNNKCWRCLGNLPDPTDANRIKESLRPFDFSKVGLSDK